MKENNGRGRFVISLDFEKYWGLRDKRTITEYKRNLEQVDVICVKTLSLFEEYGIHATWATVGLLAFNAVKELQDNIPNVLPSYKDENLSPYNYIKESINLEPQYHFAKEIISKIIQTPNQELSTHTFSHYYCLEEGQSYKEFDEDLKTAISIFKEKFNIQVKTIILPRNMVNKNYFSVLEKNGIEAFRGNESNWVYNFGMPTIFTRAFRLLDSYINITGHNIYDLKSLVTPSSLLNIPSSRFLRPVSAKNTILKKLRLKRIKKQMKVAAKKGKVFHLWWHPHNFGNDVEANLNFLKEILEYYSSLKEKYNMISLNMKEIVELKQRL